MLVLVGAGELHAEIDRIAAAHPQRFRVLPFQNQSRMPIVYRLGDLVVLFSGYGETWGLAVNEALACGRPVLVSDRVGCAADVVDRGCGRVIAWNDFAALERAVTELMNGMFFEGYAVQRRNVHGASMSLSRGAARASCQQSHDVRLRAEWRGAG